MLCKICQIEYPNNQIHSHMNKHIKNGELHQITRNKTKHYLNTQEYQEHLNNEPYTPINEEPLPEQPKLVWNITDEINNIKAVDPKTYYITSGEAIQKATQLLKDTEELHKKVKKLLNDLKRTKGTKKYLETTRENRMLLVKAKDPRNRDKTETTQ